METTLHRQLKALYAVGDGRQEVSFEGFRIDAICAGELIEIQQASLGALRLKTRNLLGEHRVRIVKPLALRKRIVNRPGRGIPVGRGRMSPRHEGWLHLFDDLVHFVDVFPHPRLTLDVVLTEQLELRSPRTPPRRFGRNYRVQDRQLTAVLETKSLRTTADLVTLLPESLPAEFTTAELARAGTVPRWLAQRIAYCLRKTGAAQPVGKQGNAWVYALEPRTTPPRPEKRSRRQGNLRTEGELQESNELARRSAKRHSAGLVVQMSPDAGTQGVSGPSRRAEGRVRPGE